MLFEDIDNYKLKTGGTQYTCDVPLIDVPLIDVLLIDVLLIDVLLNDVLKSLNFLCFCDY